MAQTALRVSVVEMDLRLNRLTTRVAYVSGGAPTARKNTERK